MKRILWYLLAGTRGGENRIKILIELKKKPKNANQLAEKLNLDYKTITHHLKVLKENQVITVVKEGEYGSVYFLSEIMEENWDKLEEIWEKVNK